jgi:thiamine pyrophosphokinase
MKKCVIIGANEFSGLLPQFMADYVIGADACPEDVQVDLLIGDFDTLTNIPADIETISFPSEKNESDLELAVEEAVRRGYDCFYIYGCLGGRLDHTIASISVLASISQRNMTGYLISEKEVITAVTNRKLTLNSKKTGTVSVFPVGGAAKGVTLTGLKYPLNDAELPFSSLGLSNEFIDEEVTIEVSNGTLIVVICGGVKHN